MTDAHPKLTRIRGQILNLAGGISRLRDGVRPESEALAAVDRHIESMAASVRINPFAFARAGSGPDPVSAYPADSHRYTCKFFPDVVRARFYEEVESIYQWGSYSG